MKVLRGNDILINWTIHQDIGGVMTNVDFSKVNLSVFIIDSYGKRDAEFNVNGNIISVHIGGEIQRLGAIGLDAYWQDKTNLTWARAKKNNIVELVDNPESINMDNIYPDVDITTIGVTSDSYFGGTYIANFDNYYTKDEIDNKIIKDYNNLINKPFIYNDVSNSWEATKKLTVEEVNVAGTLWLNGVDITTLFDSGSGGGIDEELVKILSLFAFDKERHAVYLKTLSDTNGEDKPVGFYSNSFLSALGFAPSGEGGGGGGGMDEDLLWSILGNGVNPDKQIDISHLTTALTGYATTNYVNNAISGFASIDYVKNAVNSINSSISGINTSIDTINANANTLSQRITTHINDKNVHITKEEKDAIALLFSMFELDENNNVKTKSYLEGGTIKHRGFYSESFISALGLASGSSGGGGGMDEQLLWSILGNNGTEQIAINHISNALQNYALNSELVNYATKNWVTSNYATINNLNIVKSSIDGVKSDVTTLTNTVSNLSNELHDFLDGTDTDTIINRWKELETFLNGFTETQTLSELLNYKVDKTTKIEAGIGLSGGGNLSNTVTLSLAGDIITPGTYFKTTVDTYGRVTSGTNPTSLSGFGITDGVNKIVINGTGNAITTGAISGHTLTLSKNNTFLEKATFDDLFEKVNVGTSTTPVYAIKAKYGLYTEQFLSALGLAPDLGGSGQGIYTIYIGDVAYTSTGGVINLPAYPVVTELAWGNITNKPAWIGTVKPSYVWSEIGNKPSWIGASKPTYTYDEVGAAPLSHTHVISNITDVNATWQTMLKTAPAAYNTRWAAWGEVTGKPSWIGSTKPSYTKAEVGLGNVDNTADSVKNVLSATKLTTARTLWGQSFNGTANISGAMSNVLSISGVLNSELMIKTISANSIKFVYNDDKTKAIIFNSNQFKPFDVANFKLSLGATSARWNGVYSSTGDYTGQVLAASFKRISGTASQFLKADGSIDSNVYATVANLNAGLDKKLDKTTFNDLFEKVNIGTSTTPIYAVKVKYGLYTEQFLSAMGLAPDLGGGGSQGVYTIYVGDTAYSSSNGIVRLPAYPVVTSLTWANITNKPSWIGSSKPSYNFTEIKDGGIYFENGHIQWNRNTDFAIINFKNTGDSDADSYLRFETGDNGNEGFAFFAKAATTEHRIFDIFKDRVQSFYDVTAPKFIKAGGNSSQLLRADGGVATIGWQGQAGQPNWVLGAKGQHDYEVWDPSVFNVLSSKKLLVIDIRDTTPKPINKADYAITSWFSETNTPDTVWWGGITVKGWGSTYEAWEIAGPATDSNTQRSLHYRSGANTVWGAWRTILDSSNYTGIADSRYVKKRGDTMTGILINSVSGTNTPIIVDAPGMGDNTYIKYKNGSTTLGSIGLHGVNNPAFINAAGTSYKLWHYGNDGSGSGLDADLLDGLHLHTGRNNEANKVVRTDGSGYIQVGYINISNGHEKNASSPTYVWGANSTDGYVRSYQTSKLSVAYSSNSDMLDGHHRHDLYQGKDAWMTSTVGLSAILDLSSSTYKQDTFYPCTGTSMLSKGLNLIKVTVQLNSGTKPTWSTHTNGFTCNMEIHALASGWGTTNEHAYADIYDYSFADKQPCGYSQMRNTSTPVLWLRGGGKYFVRTDYNCSWTIRTSAYTATNETISPQVGGTAPFNFTRSDIYANFLGELYGNAASATKLQTARTIWGQSFDGTKDIPTSVFGKMPYLEFKNYNDDGSAGYVGRGSSSKNTIYLTAYADSPIEMGNGSGTAITIAPNRKVYIGTTTGIETLNVGGWIGTQGTGGWYSEAYGGGIHMIDGTWVRIYNGKQFYVSSTSADAIHTSGGVNASGRGYFGGALDVKGITILNGRLAVNTIQAPNISLAIGDSDTGFNWQSDGIIQIKGNNVTIGTFGNKYFNLDGSFSVAGAAQFNGTPKTAKWWYSTGATGWFNETYTGGIYQTDSDQVRVYNNKVLYNDGYRTWGIGGHYCGLKLYQASHIGINLANSAYTWGIYSNANGNMYFGRRAGNVNDATGKYILEIQDSAMVLTGSFTATSNITANGNILAKGAVTALTSASDVRLKEKLTTYNALPVINNLRSVAYKWNDKAKNYADVFKTDATQFGLIAQELQVMFPTFVKNMFDEYLTIDYERLIPIAWRGIQELSEISNKHESRLDKLERENRELKKEVKQLKEKCYGKD